MRIRSSLLHVHGRAVLASTALALILACPLHAAAQDEALQKLASTFTERYAVQQVSDRAEPAATTPGETTPAASSPAPVEPTAAKEQAAAPDPLASLDPADRAVAEQIRELLAAKADKVFVNNKKERAAAEAFYQNRNFAPLWLDKGVESARARSVIARLHDAEAEGLDPKDYITPRLAGTPEALAEAELKLTRAVLTYARHLQGGRFAYTRVSRNIELPQALPEPAAVLAQVAEAADPSKALDAFSPPQEAYRKLKAALAELRGKTAGAKSDVARQIETVIVNMERWRWYPRDLGDTHVIVNQPDFTLRVMHNGAQAWTTRVVIGKPSMPTPLLSETMKYITINPTWHVPPSIVHNEYLPALAQDPTVLERMGLRVSYHGGEVEITMPPGDNNALGRVRFNFPNRFLVYQHDTPDKHMFADEVRAYSHGCMRVQDPAKYAEVLLKIARPGEHWTAERIKSLFGRAEQDVQIQPVPIWVHLTYQTAFVDSAGKLQFRRDVYNLDTRTLAALRSERGTMDPGIERKRDPEIASNTAPRRSARPLPPPSSPPAAYPSFFHQPAPYESLSYARPQAPRAIYR